jgi:hypothetical protein
MLAIGDGGTVASGWPVGVIGSGVDGAADGGAAPGVGGGADSEPPPQPVAASGTATARQAAARRLHMPPSVLAAGPAVSEIRPRPKIHLTRHDWPCCRAREIVRP